MIMNLIPNRPYLVISEDIPLFGTKEFGIVDYGTNLLEVKPISGCNLDCIYCYVNESSQEKLWNAYVPLNHLMGYVKKALKFKKADKIHFHISSYGEPLYYDKLPSLVKKLKKLKRAGDVSIDTNALLLTKELIHDLNDAGLDRLNVKLDVFSKRKAKSVNGVEYNVKNFLSAIKYANNFFDIILAPLLLPGVNEKDIIKIINWAKKNIKNRKWQRVVVQKYELFFYGKRPFPPQSMREFFNTIKFLEERTGERLILSFPKDLGVVRDSPIPIKFKVGDVVKAKAKLIGRWKNNTLLVSRDRVITNLSSLELNKKHEVKIIHNENNIYYSITNF